MFNFFENLALRFNKNNKEKPPNVKVERPSTPVAPYKPGDSFILDVIEAFQDMSFADISRGSQPEVPSKRSVIIEFSGNTPPCGHLFTPEIKDKNDLDLHDHEGRSN